MYTVHIWLTANHTYLGSTIWLTVDEMCLILGIGLPLMCLKFSAHWIPTHDPTALDQTTKHALLILLNL
jgi:hypothetical protein